MKTRWMHAVLGGLFAGAFTLAMPAAAHGIWVAQRAGEWSVVLGEGAVDDAYRPEAITSVVGRLSNGALAAVKQRAQARNVVLDPAGNMAAIAVAFDDGHWAQRADGSWAAGTKIQIANTKTSGRYRMFNHTVLSAGGTPAKPFGLPLEIVPLTDPMALQKGSVLRVQVLFDGRPLTGASVAGDYLGDSSNHSITTDSKGLASVTLASAGLNVIKVSHRVARLDRTEVDEDGYAATLAFTLPQQIKD